MTKEFNKVWKNYHICCKKIDWKKPFPVQAKNNLKPPFNIKKLIKMVDLNIGKFFKSMMDDKKCMLKHGHLPKMATTSRGTIGSFLASSYVEKVNLLCANLVLTEGNSLLSDEGMSSWCCT